MDAPEVPRLQDAADEALEPYDSYERFYLREYRGVVELAYVLCGNRAGAEDSSSGPTVTGTGSGATSTRVPGSGGSRPTWPPRPCGAG